MGIALHDRCDATRDVTVVADTAVSKYATISDTTILTDHAKANACHGTSHKEVRENTQEIVEVKSFKEVQ